MTGQYKISESVRSRYDEIIGDYFNSLKLSNPEARVNRLADSCPGVYFKQAAAALQQKIDYIGLNASPGALESLVSQREEAQRLAEMLKG